MYKSIGCTRNARSSLLADPDPALFAGAPIKRAPSFVNTRSSRCVALWNRKRRVREKNVIAQESDVNGKFWDRFIFEVLENKLWEW